MKRQIILLCTLCNIAIGHDSWEMCGNTVLNWQFGIHCKGTGIEILHGIPSAVDSTTCRIHL